MAHHQTQGHECQYQVEEGALLPLEIGDGFLQVERLQAMFEERCFNLLVGILDTRHRVEEELCGVDLLGAGHRQGYWTR